MISHNGINSRAMILHACASSGAIDLTVHSVAINKNAKQVIGEGRVLGIEEKAEIVNILSDDIAQKFSLISSTILAKTPYALAWWTPKAEKQITFKTHSNGQISHATHKVTFPSMVGIYIRGSLHFAVTKGGKNARPDNETPLYQIPLGNIYRDGMFCHGNASLPSGAKESNISSWNAFVFDTVNTHGGSVEALKGVSRMDELASLYADAERSGRFPTNKLIPLGCTLGEWMESLDKGGVS